MKILSFYGPRSKPSTQLVAHCLIVGGHPFISPSLFTLEFLPMIAYAAKLLQQQICQSRIVLQACILPEKCVVDR